MAKKILFLNTRLFYPTIGGRQVVLYNYCKGLHEQFGFDIDVITFLDHGDEKYLEQQPDFVKIQRVLKQGNIFEKAFNLIIYSFILRKWPLQVSLYYSRKNRKIIKDYLKNNNVDIIICDMARTAQYIVDLEERSLKKILDMDDLLSNRYKRQIENGISGLDSIGNYVKKVPKVFRSVLRVDKIMKLILYKEYKLMKEYEIYLKDFFEKIIFVSPVEAKQYNKLCNFDKADFVTIGVDYDYYNEDIDICKEEKQIVYLANLDVAHNKDAVNYFIENIYPRVLQKEPKATFKVVGKCEDLEYRNKLKKIKGVTLTGIVDDIRPNIKSGMVSSIYLPYGSGIKTKVLETMAMGIPVVTNTVGAEGISDNDALIIKDDIDSFVEEIVKLINDKDYNELMSNRCKKFINKEYRWSSTLSRFQNIL